MNKKREKKKDASVQRKSELYTTIGRLRQRKKERKREKKRGRKR